jgi:hypothetical protein
MELRLTNDDGQNYGPPLFAEAQACSAPYHQQRSMPHPFAIANHSWGRVQITLETFLNALNAANADGAPQQSHDALLEAYRQFIYASSEFAEAMLEKLPSCFVPPGGKLPRVQGERKLREHADKVCNVLKHNQNRMIIVGARCPLWNVLGYAVMAHDSNGVLRPNPNIHSDTQRAFSFSADVRRVLANSYLIGAAVGAMIRSYGKPFGDKRPSVAGKARQLIERVSALPKNMFPWERSQDMAVIKFDGDTLEVRDRGGDGLIFQGTHTVSQTIQGDGATNKFAFE